MSTGYDYQVANFYARTGGSVTRLPGSGGGGYPSIYPCHNPSGNPQYNPGYEGPTQRVGMVFSPYSNVVIRGNPQFYPSLGGMW